ncbi:MAG: hypothetical protein ABJ239_03745 [Erythrobacter sp.]
MARIGFLACETTLPGSSARREDAFEHDLSVQAIQPAIEAAGHDFSIIDWAAPIEQFAGFDLVMLGTAWNYQDREQEFLTRLDALEAADIKVCNSSEIVRWNVRKTYLKELASKGAGTIPTMWLDRASASDVEQTFDAFEADTIVIKRQVGAGAEGQHIFHRGKVPATWQIDRPAMLQPFMPAIQAEGEYSLIFIDGEFSHALIKRATPGEYRIQSLYGGTEQAINPSPEDRAAADAIMASLPFAAPLYARIDMVRGPENSLLLMEAELIEPYLYPNEGPELGPRLGRAINRRLTEI